MEYIFLVIVLALILVIVVQQRGHAAEREKLLDRIMSKDIHEYKAVTDQVEPSAPVILTDEEEWAREIESMKG